MPLMRYLLSGCPAQIRFASCQRLVQPAYYRGMGRGLDNLRIRARFFSDLLHHAHEVVQRLTRLRLCWLDHHRLVYDQRDVDGWRVHAKVEDALGDVERGHP